MQPRHVLARGISAAEFLDDGFERERGGVDDPRAGRTEGEQFLRHERAGVETDGRTGDEVAAAQSDEVRRPGTGADEMDRHRPLPRATAQATPSPIMRFTTRRASRPAPASAAASETEATPSAAFACGEGVAILPSTARKASAGRNSSGRPIACAAPTSPASPLFASMLKSRTDSPS